MPPWTSQNLALAETLRPLRQRGIVLGQLGCWQGRLTGGASIPTSAIAAWFSARSRANCRHSGLQYFNPRLLNDLPQPAQGMAKPSPLRAIGFGM